MINQVPFPDGMSRQSSAQGPRGSATRRTVNLDDTDEPYQMSSKQEVGKSFRTIRYTLGSSGFAKLLHYEANLL